jgi:ABC-2 type transport system permease protein
MLRTHVILSVFRRNFWSYFSGVIGYLFIVAFVLAGALLAFREEFFSDNVASLDKLNAYFPHLLLFIIPAITMGVWSEEKKLGTDELLFTLPVSDLEVLLGKYLSVVAVYSVVLLFSLTNTVVLQFIGDPDWGLIAATYLGYWLAGCALLSAGMAASFLTNSTTVAFVLGTLVCAVPVFIGNLPVTRPLASEFPTNILGQAWFYLQSIPGLLVNEQIVRNLSIPYHFEQFARGFFPLTAVFYFVSFAAFFLYVNLVLIGERHWAGGVKGTNMGWQYLVRAVSVLLLLISTNAVLANIRWQPDLTSERLYTLTGTTTDLLRNIPEKRPVTVQAFVSRNVPRDYISVRTLLLGMLQQYESHSGGRVTVRIVEVDPFSEQAEEARKYGIEPRKVQSERGGRVQVDDVFLGSVISSGANEVVVPFFDTAIPVEYELTRSIRTVTNESRRTVGILETDAKIAGGFDMSSFRTAEAVQRRDGFADGPH